VNKGTAHLYLGVGRFLFLAPHLDAGVHHHNAMEIMLSLRGSFAVRTGSSGWKTARAVFINSNVPHQFKDFSGMSASFQFLPERWRTSAIRRVFSKGQAARYLDSLDLFRYVQFFRGLERAGPSCSRVFRVCEDLLEDITGTTGCKGPVDDRLLSALDHIQVNLTSRISSTKLAHEVCLSNDRFLHLFKEQMGIPLRQYVLHQRLMCGSAAIVCGKSVTQAAVDSGFSDSSHFTRRFVEFSGLRPSQLKQFHGKARMSTCSSSRCVRVRWTDLAGGECHFCRLSSALCESGVASRTG
jgi:methylphosphotriester-DNA--protein-cysteine methyltransferase